MQPQGQAALWSVVQATSAAIQQMPGVSCSRPRSAATPHCPLRNGSCFMDRNELAPFCCAAWLYGCNSSRSPNYGGVASSQAESATVQPFPGRNLFGRGPIPTRSRSVRTRRLMCTAPCCSSCQHGIKEFDMRSSKHRRTLRMRI
jgi:hypothetical protein